MKVTGYVPGLAVAGTTQVRGCLMPPVALVCPEFTAAQAREWVENGEVPELAKSKEVSYIDIDSGHWPMITVPAELARLLARAAEES